MTSRRLPSALLDQNSEDLIASLLVGVSDGEIFDAAEILATDSRIASRPSLIVDLAYEDYWRRIQSGLDIDVEQFVAQFPVVRDRLLHMISVGNLIHQSPEFFLDLLQPIWPSAPCELGCYEILSQFGAGSFSRVYHAKDFSFNGREVTLKISRPQTREVQALSQLNHPGIISPLARDTDLIPGLEVLVMPFSGRATLADLIHKNLPEKPKPFEFDYQLFLQKENAGIVQEDHCVFQAPQSNFVETGIWIGAQLAEALAYAHACRCFHCDIKPANVHLRPDGRPVLLDFNLSVSAEDQIVPGGTLAYIAPEQLQLIGRSTGINGAADVFSLGATLIELFQGSPPFEVSDAHSAKSIGLMHPLVESKSHFSFETKIRKRIGKRLASLLEACVAPNPLTRPTSATLAQELNQLLQLPRFHWRTNRFQLTILLVVVLISLLFAYSMLSPNYSSSAHYQFGVAAIQAHSPQSALRHFSKVLSVDSQRCDAKFLLACSQIQIGDWNSASVHLRELVKQRPNPELRSLLGYVLCRTERQIEIAEIELVQALEEGLLHDDVLNNLAYCQVRLNKLSAAEHTFAIVADCHFDSTSLVLNEALAEAKRCQQDRHVPRASIGEKVMHHPVLANSLDGLLAVIPIYWTLSRNDPHYKQIASDVLRSAVDAGVTRTQLQAYEQENWPGFYNLTQELFFQQFKASTEQNSEVIDRLMPPPIIGLAKSLEFANRL